MMNLNDIDQNNFYSCSMNNRLIDLYSIVDNAFGPIFAEFNAATGNDCSLTNPFYAVVSESYSNAKNKVVILGQETNTWGGEFEQGGEYQPSSTLPIVRLCRLYDLYVNHNNQDFGQYWNYCKRLMSLANKDTGFFFFNTALVGLCGKTGCVKEIQPHILSEVFDIVQPNLIIFLCGPNYDDLIRSHFHNLIDFLPARKEYSSRQFSKIIGLCAPAFRCYHPGFLYRHSSVRASFEGIIRPLL